MVRVLTCNSEYRLVGFPHCGIGATGELYKVVGRHLLFMGRGILTVNGVLVGGRLSIWLPETEEAITTSVIQEVLN